MKLEVLSALLVALLVVQTNAQGDFINLMMMRALAGGGNSGSSYSPPSSYPTAGGSSPATGSGATTGSSSAVGYGRSRGRGQGGLFGGGMGPMMAMSGGMGDFMVDYMRCRIMPRGYMRSMCMMNNM